LQLGSNFQNYLLLIMNELLLVLASGVSVMVAVVIARAAAARAELRPVRVEGSRERRMRGRG
jgi:hypothetical protein